MRIMSRDEVRAVDRRAIEEFGLAGVVLMENAGRSVVEAIVARFGGEATHRVAIFCGIGNNGGDGFVIARHLANRDWPVRIVVVGETSRYSGDAKINLDVCRAAGMAIESADAIGDALTWADVVVDAMLGTGFTGPMRDPIGSAIAAINASGRPVVAVDVPSGLDCQSGEASTPTIRAMMTVTFVAAKPGLVLPNATPFVGELLIGDIGVPKACLPKME